MDIKQLMDIKELIEENIKYKQGLKTKHTDAEYDELTKNIDNPAVIGIAEGKEPIEKKLNVKKKTLDKMIYKIQKSKTDVITISPKFDGCYLNITIDDDLNITKILTRGNGVVGKDVTEKCKDIKMSHYPIKGVDSYELVYNGKDVSQEEARSKVAAFLHKKKVTQAEKLDLIIIPHFYNDNMQMFRVDQNDLIPTLEFIRKYIDYSKSIEQYTDGVVVSINKDDHYAVKHVNNVIYKTRLLDIEYKLGAKGIKTSAVGLIEPIKIGTHVHTRVNLHSKENIEKLNIKVNCMLHLTCVTSLNPKVVECSFD